MSTYNNSRKFNAEIRNGLNAGLTKAAMELARYMRAIQQKRGIGPRAASRPGEPPNRQTSALYNQITFVPSKNLVSYAGATARHGLYMERGVRWTRRRRPSKKNSARIKRFGVFRVAPRPWAFRSFLANKTAIARAAQETYNKHIRAAAAAQVVPR